MIEAKALSWREAKEAIDNLVRCAYDSQPFNTADLDIAIKAVNTNLQFRDYILGLPNIHDAKLIGYVCAEIGSYAHERNPDGEDDLHFMVICSAFLYEWGMLEQARHGLDLALSRGDNSLANLLVRCLDSNMPSTMFSQMRNDLHDKVVGVILRNYDNPITEGVE